MPIRLILQKKQIKDLAVIRELNIETILEITNKFTEIEQTAIHPTVLHKTLCNGGLLTSDIADIVIEQLMSFCTIIKQRNISKEELLKALYHAFKNAEFPWSQKEVDVWKKKVEPSLLNILSSPSLWSIIKALDLSYDYVNLLQNVKIITDIRPIFDKDASSIQGSIISYTLRLYFDSLEGSKDLSITLNEKDVERLQAMCERALEKSKCAKEFMCKNGVKKTFICGEEE